MFISSYEMREIIQNWKREAGATRPIMFSIKKNTVIIHTSQPGYLIGKVGGLFNKFNSLIQEKYGKDTRVEIDEVAYDII